MSSKGQFGLPGKVTQNLTEIFRKYPSIEKVIIYGSCAKGNFRPSSDIDLTIISNEKNLSFLFKIENEIEDLLLPYKVDLSLYATLDNENLKQYIEQVGIEFYRK